jgi:hypothetical protein
MPYEFLHLELKIATKSTSGYTYGWTGATFYEPFDSGGTMIIGGETNYAGYTLLRNENYGTYRIRRDSLRVGPPIWYRVSIFQSPR